MTVSVQYSGVVVIIGKGDRSGTNICQAFKTILDSMGVEKINDVNFTQTQHVIIMFTDGTTYKHLHTTW